MVLQLEAGESIESFEIRGSVLNGSSLPFGAGVLTTGIGDGEALETNIFAATPLFQTNLEPFFIQVKVLL